MPHQVTHYFMTQQDLDDIRLWSSEGTEGQADSFDGARQGCAFSLSEHQRLVIRNPVSRYDLLGADYDFLEQGPRGLKGIQTR